MKIKTKTTLYIWLSFMSSTIVNKLGLLKHELGIPLICVCSYYYVPDEESGRTLETSPLYFLFTVTA